MDEKELLESMKRQWLYLMKEVTALEVKIVSIKESMERDAARHSVERTAPAQTCPICNGAATMTYKNIFWKCSNCSGTGQV